MDFYQKAEHITRKWWLYALLFLVPGILPPYAGTGLGYWRRLSDFTWYVSDMMYYRKLTFGGIMPVMHLIVAVLFLALLIFKAKLGRAFPLLVSLHFIYIAFMQTGVRTEEYGLVIVSELLTWYIIVLSFWLWETWARKTEFTLRPEGIKPYWAIPLALFAFWDPDKICNLDPRYFIISYSPTSFCMMAPIYLTVLLFCYPRVNLPLLRVMSFIGIVVGVITLVITFMKGPSDGIYWTLLHAPLIIISVYAFVLGMKTRPQHSTRPHCFHQSRQNLA